LILVAAPYIVAALAWCPIPGGLAGVSVSLA
jgi:hypothetical protein